MLTPTFSMFFHEDHWFNISAIDVLDSKASSIAILGNSITDGKGSTNDAQNRWPDFFSAALHVAEKRKDRSVKPWYWRQ